MANGKYPPDEYWETVREDEDDSVRLFAKWYPQLVFCAVGLLACAGVFLAMFEIGFWAFLVLWPTALLVLWSMIPRYVDSVDEELGPLKTYDRTLVERNPMASMNSWMFSSLTRTQKKK